MATNIDDFVVRIPDVEDQPPAKMIDYFAYYLSVECGEPVVVESQIIQCFEEANVEPYSRVSTHLARQSKKTKTRRANYIRKNGGYRLARHREGEIRESLLDLNAPVVAAEAPALGFAGLLHPLIAEHAMGHFENGYFRDAVLNAYIAVFDFIRARTGLQEDGSKLATKAFSLDKGHLVFSTLDTESGRNDQKGFMQIFQGAYTGIRNPKAHTLVHDLTDMKAAQYLVFASLLARRVEEAYPGPEAKT